MAEGLPISGLTPELSFSQAAQLNAQFPLAYNSLNARTGVRGIETFVNQTISRALNGVAEEKDLRALEARVTHNEHEIAQLWEKDDTIDLDVITDASISGNESTVFVETDYANLKTEATSSDSIPLPVASPVQAGVMNAATYNALQTAISDIAGIIGQSWLVMANLGAAATAASVNAAWVSQTGQQPRDGNTVINIGNNNELWKYGNYQGTNQWVLTASSFNLTAFTNTMLGGIKGSLQKYQVFAEPDGSGSVNGLDLLESLVNTNANNIANHARNADIHVTAADKASWNGKVNWRGDWVAGRQYAIGDMFYHDGRIYVCQIATVTGSDPYIVATRNDSANYFACIDTKDIRDSIKNLSLAGDVTGPTSSNAVNVITKRRSLTSAQVNNPSTISGLTDGKSMLFSVENMTLPGIGTGCYGTMLINRRSDGSQATTYEQLFMAFYINGDSSTIWYRSRHDPENNFVRLASTADLGSYLPLLGGLMAQGATINWPNQTTSVRNLISATVGDNDQAAIRAGSAGSNAGYLELATGDDGSEPIYVSQYSGGLGTQAPSRRTALLDESGYMQLASYLHLGNGMENATPIGGVMFDDSDLSGYVRRVSFDVFRRKLLSALPAGAFSPGAATNDNQYPSYDFNL